MPENLYPAIEDKTVSDDALRSGDISSLTASLGLNFPTAGIKTREQSQKAQFAVNQKINDLESDIHNFQNDKTSKAADAYQKSVDDAKQKYDERNLEDEKKLNELTKAGMASFAPTQENMVDLASLFSVVGIIGMMMGGSGRNSAMNALSSMTGMMEGYKEGQIQRFKEEKVKFDEHLNQIKAERDSIQQELNRIAAEWTSNKEKAQLDYEVFKSKLNSQVAKDLDKVGGFKTVYQNWFKSVDDGIKSAEDLHNKLVEKSVEYQYRMKEKQGEGAELGYGNFLKNTIGARAKDEKTNKSIVENGQGVASVDKAINTFKDPEIKQGVKLSLESIKEKIKSLGPEDELTNEQVNSLINGAVNPTDKNAVAVKDALFAAFNIERAAQGGRVTVQMMNVGGSALNPKNYTKEGYIAILGGRRNDLINNLRGQGLNDQQITTLVGSFGKQQPEIQVTKTTENAPAVGKIQDGYRFKGGDPSKQENWEKVK